MESCIQPTCSCHAYKAPKQSKGTLLQLRLGCQTCGHQASEHRKLTAIDRYIEREVTKASKCGQCSHQIPTREIPSSPVFRQYDLIPLPSDDNTMATEQENSIRCTCGGFQVQNLVRLWQKFRTHTLDNVKTSLPVITCSFCQHPLSSHFLPDKNESTSSEKVVPQTKNSFTQLVVKEPTKLALNPLNASVLLVPPEEFSDYMRLLAIRKAAESSVCGSQLELVAVSQCFSSKKLDIIKEEKVSSTVCTESDLVNSLTDKEMNVDPVENSKNDNISTDTQEKHAGVSVATSNGINTSSSGVKEQENQLVKPATKKGTKRRRKASSVSEDGGTRRSARIAAKKKKVEVDMSSNGSQTSPATAAKLQLKELKASRDSARSSKAKKSKKKLSLCFTESISHIEEEEMVCPSKLDLERMGENCASFAQVLNNPDSFETKCTLPSDFSSLDSHLVMAAHSINHHVIKNLPNTKEGDKMASRDLEEGKDNNKEDSGILVAVGSESGSMVQLTIVNPIISQLKEDVVPLWTLLKLPTTDSSTKVTSMSWSRTSENGPTVVHFSTGCTDGGLYTWKVKLSSDKRSIEDTLPMAYQSNTKSPITVCSWALNGNLLVVGTILGEVLFYQICQEADLIGTTAMEPEPKMEHLQTIHCCGGSVRCATWSSDSRLLAVGASDDYIQILQCRDPRETRQPPPSASSILKYFKREDSGGKQRFVHTHCLRGHQSFIADVKFLGHYHSLVSIGWDGQILFWPNLLVSLPKSHPPHHHHHVHSNHKELPYTEVEPLGGYKLGPSAIVEFLPIAVHPLICNSGLVVLLQNRLGGFTVISCLKKLAR